MLRSPGTRVPGSREDTAQVPSCPVLISQMCPALVEKKTPQREKPPESQS